MPADSIYEKKDQRKRSKAVGIYANKRGSAQATDFCPASVSAAVKASFYRLLLLWCHFSPPQVNGVNIEGLRHSEVVALIKAGQEGVRLLVVDLETDELYLRLGLPPAASQGKGPPARSLTH